MHFRELVSSDIDKLIDLQPEGWDDIRPYLSDYLKHDFCDPIKAINNNTLTGIGSANTFGRTAWLAHIIVATKYRQQGIGYDIVKELLERLSTKQVESILLLATDLGLSVYKKFGFKPVSEYKFLARKTMWPDYTVSQNIITYTERYYGQVLSLDQNISGEKREPLLKQYIATSLLFVKNNELQGLYIPNLGEGSIIASSQNAGIELMKFKYSKTDNAVLPSENKEGIKFLLKSGFEESTKRGTRMLLGKSIEWKPDQIYSRIGGNFG